MKYILLAGLQAALVGGFLFGSTSARAQAQDPAELADGNLFTNPGFTGNSCFEGWEPTPNMNLHTNLCASEVGTLWFNHNGQSPDPGVTQIVNLKPGKNYLLQWQWRAGDTANTYEGPDPKPYFGVQISDDQLKAFSPNSDLKSWKIDSISFTADSESKKIGFYGEVNGLDGDVALNWVSLKRDISNELPTHAKLFVYSINAKGQTAESTADDHYLVDEGGVAKIKTNAAATAAILDVEQLGDGKVAFKTNVEGIDQYLTVTAESDSAVHTYMVDFKPGKSAGAEFFVSTALICADGQGGDSVACTDQEVQQSSTPRFVSLESVSAKGVSSHYLRHAGLRVGLYNTTSDSSNLEKQDSVWRIDPIE